LIRLLVLAYSVGCWVVLGGVLSPDLQGSCSTHGWQCCTAWQSGFADAVLDLFYIVQ
jgi:hypothetical protein